MSREEASVPRAHEPCPSPGLLVGHFVPPHAAKHPRPTIPTGKVFLSTPMGHSRKPCILGMYTHSRTCAICAMPDPLNALMTSALAALPRRALSTAERARIVRADDIGGTLRGITDSGCCVPKRHGRRRCAGGERVPGGAAARVLPRCRQRSSQVQRGGSSPAWRSQGLDPNGRG